MKQIAHIETPFGEKFGVPRQAGLVDYEARVVFEPEYRVAEAVRGLEEFDYVWLLWEFHLNKRDKTDAAEQPGASWSPTVRPPRLGGNRRVGVFASRSPFRPNPIGLSSVRLLRIEEGPVLVVGGADLVDGTPIYDIKPYIEYADSHAGVRCGYAQQAPRAALEVADPHHLLDSFAPADRTALAEALRQDPRPHYQTGAGRLYTMAFGGREVQFSVEEEGIAVLKNVKGDNRKTFPVS